MPRPSSFRGDFRYRQIHLDFHTSEHIENVGAEFDETQFIESLKLGNVDSVTVFAKCHHGWAYYPTKVGAAHPHLRKPLLPLMLDACKKANINAPVYITVQWDERTARERPEWRVVKAVNAPFQAETSDNSALNQLSAQWHSLCLSNEGYVDHVIALAEEVVDLYRPIGLFLDILLPWECVCQKCLVRMRKHGLDPNVAADRIENHRGVIQEYYEKFAAALWAKDPGLRFFHNSGHVYKGERKRWDFMSHLELESLPTGGWGYDHFPLSALYSNTLGKEFLGMTGKFHTTWGEFGGFKRSAALEYECALMTSFGARCSVGDQLHPSGRMERATYESIGPAYAKVKALEPWLLGARPESEVAVYSAEGHFHDRKFEMNDIGAGRMLLESQIPFALIDSDEDFSKYAVIVLPDVITLDGPILAKFQAFLKAGGSVILSGTSGMTPALDAFALPLRAKVKGDSPFHPDYLVGSKALDASLVDAPFQFYAHARRVKADGAEVLLETRVPYFNRTWEHFSSHQHAPFRMERNGDYDGLLRDGRVFYFSHAIFDAYFRTGQPLLKYAFRGAMNLALAMPRTRVKMPSQGRFVISNQEKEGRRVAHFLYAQTQLRGNGAPVWGGEMKMEILEDVVPCPSVAAEIRLEKKPDSVTLVPQGVKLAHSWEAGVLRFEVPSFEIHQAVEIR